MQLPGGFQSLLKASDSACRFARLTGVEELSLWEVLGCGQNRPAIITDILNLAFSFKPEGQDAADLCDADRQYLLAAFARKNGIFEIWLSVTCSECDSVFDVSVNLSALPLKPASTNYPKFRIAGLDGEVFGRVPSGQDLEVIADLTEDEAVQVLAKRCIETDDPNSLKKGDVLAAFDHALDEHAPELASSIVSSCLDCGHEIEVPFDLAKAVIESFENPILDVHILASEYHWSESQILALPQRRRQSYLDLIEQKSGGMG